MTIRGEIAVVLCGGKGRRLGNLSERLPKVLAPVNGKPILWYVLLRLHQAGFRRFVLPLGYLGNEIRAFVDRELSGFDAHIDMIETGDDTAVGRRLLMVRSAIASQDFLLVNGDTLFDFDLADLMALHRTERAQLTLTSCQIVSQYGLLILDRAGKVVDFMRDAAVDRFILRGDGKAGVVNAGIAVLSRTALETPGIETTREFEQHVYPGIIAAGGCRNYRIDGFWHAIDTQKDLEIVSPLSRDPRAQEARALAEKLDAYACEWAGAE